MVKRANLAKIGGLYLVGGIALGMPPAARGPEVTCGSLLDSIAAAQRFSLTALAARLAGGRRWPGRAARDPVAFYREQAEFISDEQWARLYGASGLASRDALLDEYLARLQRDFPDRVDLAAVRALVSLIRDPGIHDRAWLRFFEGDEREPADLEWAAGSMREAGSRELLLVNSFTRQLATARGGPPAERKIELARVRERLHHSGLTGEGRNVIATAIAEEYLSLWRGRSEDEAIYGWHTVLAVAGLCYSDAAHDAILLRYAAEAAAADPELQVALARRTWIWGNHFEMARRLPPGESRYAEMRRALGRCRSVVNRSQRLAALLAARFYREAPEVAADLERHPVGAAVPEARLARLPWHRWSAEDLAAFLDFFGEIPERDKIVRIWVAQRRARALPFDVRRDLSILSLAGMLDFARECDEENLAALIELFIARARATRNRRERDGFLEALAAVVRDRARGDQLAILAAGTADPRVSRRILAPRNISPRP